MRRFRKTAIALLAFALLALTTAVLFLHFGQNSAWQINHSFRDPATAEVVPAAMTTNDSGFQMAVFRNKDIRVRIYFSLPRGSFDQLSRTGRIAAYRPDGKDAAMIEMPTTRLVEAPWIDGSSVRSLLWHGTEPIPVAGTLRNILDARMLDVRFFTDRGSTIDTIFDLKGASAVIGDALNIQTEVDPKATQKAEAAKKLIIAATSRCTPTMVRGGTTCLDAFLKCSPDNRELTTFDERKFKSCLAEMGWPLD